MVTLNGVKGRKKTTYYSQRSSNSNRIFLFIPKNLIYNKRRANQG